MKPIPATDFADIGRPFPAVLPAPQPRNESPSNFRRSSTPSQRAYPWLLVSSTIIASVFFFLYITKPVVHLAGEKSPAPAVPTPAPETKTPAAGKPAALPKSLVPGSDKLPGDSAGPAPSLAKKDTPAFEETNLRVQHVLTARISEGDISRLVLDVPVLYQSRQLRWTQEEVERARGLLARLSDYQEKSRNLRTEGNALLSEWNQLVGKSIPAQELRADSPSLPMNQREAGSSDAPSGFDSSESIQLNPSGK